MAKLGYRAKLRDYGVSHRDREKNREWGGVVAIWLSWKKERAAEQSSVEWLESHKGKTH